jgi:uncharacterized protein
MREMMISMTDIQEVADHIAREFAPECIILFGSYARGRANPDSDVDLLIIMSFEGNGFWKSLEIVNRINPSFSADFIARRPDDTARRYAQGDPLIREALDHGKVLYERCGA